MIKTLSDTCITTYVLGHKNSSIQLIFHAMAINLTRILKSNSCFQIFICVTFLCYSLRKKCPNMEFFLVRIFLHLE